MKTGNFFAAAAFLALSSVAIDSAAWADDDARVEADNSRRNRVDYNSNTALPEDQSNNREFLERTAAIRKTITDRDDLSVTAQNVKVITLDDGTVVLRGPVKTEQEKAIIENTANKLSDSAPVKSFLVVTR